MTGDRACSPHEVRGPGWSYGACCPESSPPLALPSGSPSPFPPAALPCLASNSYSSLKTPLQALLRQKHFLAAESESRGTSCLPQLLPSRYLSSSSQMLQREAGSTPAVGSSRMTTREPPTKVMATESFCCVPPGQRQVRGSQQRPLSLGQGCVPSPCPLSPPPGSPCLAPLGLPDLVSPLASHGPWGKVPTPFPAPFPPTRMLLPGWAHQRGGGSAHNAWGQAPRPAVDGPPRGSQLLHSGPSTAQMCSSKVSLQPRAGTTAPVAGRAPRTPSPATPDAAPPGPPRRTSDSTSYCGQAPRWGRTASILDWTSWPRMRAEPPVGGKRPHSRDLGVKGSQSSCPFRGGNGDPQRRSKST